MKIVDGAGQQGYYSKTSAQVRPLLMVPWPRVPAEETGRSGSFGGSFEGTPPSRVRVEPKTGKGGPTPALSSLPFCCSRGPAGPAAPRPAQSARQILPSQFESLPKSQPAIIKLHSRTASIKRGNFNIWFDFKAVT